VGIGKWRIITIITNMSVLKKRQLSQSSVLGTSFCKLENKENLNHSEVREMLQVLQAYETLCIQREDFSGADSVKNKIEQLKAQEVISRKEDIAVKEKQQVTVHPRRSNPSARKARKRLPGSRQSGTRRCRN
jgi:hypothetical protein